MSWDAAFYTIYTEGQIDHFYLERQSWLFVRFVYSGLSETSANWYKALAFTAFQMTVDVKSLTLAATVARTVFA